MPRTTRFRSWLWDLSVAALGLLVALALLERQVAERWWVTILVTYAPQQPAVAIPALLLIVSVVTRHWRATAVNAGAVLLGVFLLLGVHVPLHGPPRAVGVPLRVMTFNVEGFRRSTPGGLRRLAERERVDVLCLQEACPAGSHQASRDLLRSFAGWHLAARGEIAILSRLPLLGQRAYRAADTSRVVQEAEIDCRGTRVTVFDVHFSVAMLPESLARHQGSLSDYLHRTAEVRRPQAGAVLGLVRRSRGPVLVLGDFNTPPRGLVYRQLAARLQDGFAAVGLGSGATYPAGYPLLRIDYVFTSAGAHVRRCRVLPERGLSDHRPVLAEMTF